jgi:hypothetical protein
MSQDAAGDGPHAAEATVSPPLEGRWRVQRCGGVLPPLVGVGQVIAGGCGWTTVAGLKVARFDVVGLELRYRPPFSGVVDVLAPESDSSLAGRATFRGREIGAFRMTRVG